MFWLFRCNGDPMIRKLFQKFCQLCCLCFCQYFKHLPRQFLCKSAAIGNTYRVTQVFHHQLLVTVFKFQVSAMTSCRFFRKYSCSCVLSTPFTVSADSSQFLEHPGQFFFVSFIVIFLLFFYKDSLSSQCPSGSPEGIGTGCHLRDQTFFILIQRHPYRAGSTVLFVPAVLHGHRAQ